MIPLAGGLGPREPAGAAQEAGCGGWGLPMASGPSCLSQARNAGPGCLPGGSEGLWLRNGGRISTMESHRRQMRAARSH
eukprot:scaffold74048_cov30-Tisochrysis_lutea.AAC.1